ncbi:MAG: hypothetical protein WD077_09630 [Bacteroidia bacterium]
MKTIDYNPSKSEIEFSKALQGLMGEMEKRVSFRILSSRHQTADNPYLHLKIEDKDGDRHEMIIKFIQRYED